MSGDKWTLARGIDPDDKRMPHRLTSPKDDNEIWLTDAEVDAIEAVLPFLNGVRPLPDTGPQRFTAEAEPVEVSIWEGSKLLGSIDVGTAADRDAFVAQVNGTRTDDLPAGVHRIDGRLWLLPEHPLPDGWEARGSSGWATDIITATRWATYEVRPVSQPATERVPILDAIASSRVMVGADGTPMPTAGHDVNVYLRNGRWRAMYDDAGHAVEHRPVADADGTVEVLVVDGGRS